MLIRSGVETWKPAWEGEHITRRAASHSLRVLRGYSEASSDGEAFVWTLADGMVGLGDLPGGDVRSWAHGISPDGSVIVGESQSATGKEAFYWTASEGMVGLGHLDPAYPTTYAGDASEGGTILIGSSATAPADKGWWPDLAVGEHD